MLDVLSFYQERIANEAFLRTATERRSVLELARLIGYELAPGVAAGTCLAFTLEDAPGSRRRRGRAGDDPGRHAGAERARPGRGAADFETVEPVEARVEWNAIPVADREPQASVFGRPSCYLAGTAPARSPATRS